MEQTQIHFDGVTYDPKLDYTRLTTQLGKIYNLLNTGRWFTLRQLADLIKAPEASVSARIRDLRKPKFGEHNIEHERLSNGVWRYRMVE
jgi:hypothetical protein|tara:strand:+ start:294 stop:560 length:267 start_codon:yes stop_codon:yes gene_type:complete